MSEPMTMSPTPIPETVSPDTDAWAPAPATEHPAATPPTGYLARLGGWTAGHFRVVVSAWVAVLALFGAFAPQIEHALAGAGWQDSTSQSVKARQIVQKQFGGLGATALQVVVVDHRASLATDPAAQALEVRAASLLRADPRVSVVIAPRPGVSLSADGRTGVMTAGANAEPNAMVRAATALAGQIQRLSRPGISVSLTGDSALWANFNAVNRSAMLRSEMLSWPVALIILVLAFGSLVAAGLPLMLTMVGLMVAAGALVLATHVAPVSIWALNFALMFALALGIDYALFLVVRFRAALNRRGVQSGDHAGVVAAVAETVDTAGKAVAFSAATVVASLAAILLLPSPAFRSTALGIMLAVTAVLAATLTLLSAVLGRLGTRIDAGRLIGRRSRERPAGWTTACRPGVASCGAIPFRPVWLRPAYCSWRRCPWSACAPTCPPSPSCPQAPTPGWATTRSPTPSAPAPPGPAYPPPPPSPLPPSPPRYRRAGAGDRRRSGYPTHLDCDSAPHPGS